MNQELKKDQQFRKNLNAMIKRSMDFQKQFENHQPEEPIYKLLGEFVKFSDEYIELLGKVPGTISRNCFVVNNGIEKLLQEWNVLSRASEQRLIGDLKENLDKASDMAKTYCDKWNAIPRDKPYHALETPVVYFEKLFRISRAIYAPQIPVISIPLTDYDQPENWQSLAHELSHHIFWNGFNPDEISAAHQELDRNISTQLFSTQTSTSILGKIRSLRQQVDRVEIWENWLEEVFADVYGTLLAGLPYAISSQDRMAVRVNRDDDFLLADHHHPCVYLRPFISLYTLDFVAKEVSTGQADVEALRKRWSDFSGRASQLKYKNFTLSDLAEDARKVVEIILCSDYWPVKFDPVKQLAGPISVRTLPLELEPVVNENPLEISYPDLDSITLPQSFEAIKEQLLDTSTRLVQALGLKRPDEDAKMLAWLSLTGLELSDISNYHVHGCTGDHSHILAFWMTKHYHPQDGSSVESC